MCSKVGKYACRAALRHCSATRKSKLPISAARYEHGHQRKIGEKMPKIQRSGQDWILDRFIGTLGVNALMPGFMTFMASPIVGFNNADLDYITSRTKGVSSMRETYRKVGDFRAGLAKSAEELGYTVTARR